MKKTLFIILAISFIATACSKKTKTETKTDPVLELFTWNIQELEMGKRMILDVPFSQDDQDSIEHLILSVIKENDKERPNYIALYIPSNIDKSEGVFINFINEKEEEEESGIVLAFETCIDDYCFVRIHDGFILDENTNQKIDIFQKFIDFNKIYFMFIYPDGSHKSVLVPLYSFQEQYRNL